MEDKQKNTQTIKDLLNIKESYKADNGHHYHCVYETHACICQELTNLKSEIKEISAFLEKITEPKKTSFLNKLIKSVKSIGSQHD